MPGAETVTVTERSTLPPAPVQLIVYVPVAVKFVSVWLSTPGVFVPVQAPEASQVEAFVAAQLSLVEPSYATVDGVAVSVNVGTGGATFTVTD
jgi:hypothetical protein